jgi:hypothetical protein
MRLIGGEGILQTTGSRLCTGQDAKRGKIGRGNRAELFSLVFTPHAQFGCATAYGRTGRLRYGKPKRCMYS